MGVIIKGFDKPEDCLGCPFLSKLTEVSVGSDGLYKKIGYCKFAPVIMPDLEDPWHGMEWLHTHTEEWCPMTQINENGTPYNPTGDLISRRDLKLAIREMPDWCGDDAYYSGVNDVSRLIDNAQAVPLPSEQIAWEQGFEAGVAQGKQNRPQGEWCYGEDECGQDGWFCSECGFFVPWYYQYYEKDINFIRDYKACPHCLAEMVTYTGKDRDTEGGTE